MIFVGIYNDRPASRDVDYEWWLQNFFPGEANNVHEPLQGFSRGFSINAYFLRGDEKPPSCSTAYPQIGIRTQMSHIAQGLMVFEKIEKNEDKNNSEKHTCSSV